MVMPAARYACWTSDEQSHWWAGSPECAAVQSPSRWYGVPSCARAQKIAATTAGGVLGGRAKLAGSGTESLPAWPSPPSPPQAKTPPAPPGPALLSQNVPEPSVLTSIVASGSCLAYAS